MKKLLSLKPAVSSLAWIAGLSLVSGAAFAQDNPFAAANANAVKIANQYSCLSCHNAEVKMVGPSYKSVAEKYAGQADAVDMLVKKVTNGGSGNWGRIPMPAHPQIGPENTKLLVEWVLRGAPSK